MANTNLKLDVKSNIKQFTKGIDKIARSQIPFATNLTIGNTVFKLSEVAKKETVKHIDRPTRQTVKSILYKAPKRNKKALPIGYVFFKDFASKYMKYAIEGGMRPFKQGRVLPTRNSKLNAFGNITNHRQIISKSKSMKNRFVRSKGIYQKTKGGIPKLLFVFEKRAVKYKKIFPFYEIMQKKSSRFFDHYFKKNLKKVVDAEKLLIAKGFK